MPPQEPHMQAIQSAAAAAAVSYNSLEQDAEQPEPAKAVHESSSSNNKNNTNATNEYVLNVAFYSFLGFVCVQGVFAWIAHSQAMMADSQAMMVDALTYLANLWAERSKANCSSDNSKSTKLSHLYWEMIPPLLSVTTLVGVTVMTLQQAWATLQGMVLEEEDSVSVPIMFLFSAANLLLDVVNVTCFARAEATGSVRLLDPWNTSSTTNCTTCTSSTKGERHALLKSGEQDEEECKHTNRLNLNMCSAWTHVCADTLRSTAVLVAAALAYFLPQFIDGDVADSVAAILVSMIILVSLLPLVHGLIHTARQIVQLWKEPKEEENCLALDV